METWSILSFIVACISLGAMIKIAISTSKLEKNRSHLFEQMSDNLELIKVLMSGVEISKETKNDNINHETPNSEILKESLDDILSQNNNASNQEEKPDTSK